MGTESSEPVKEKITIENDAGIMEVLFIGTDEGGEMVVDIRFNGVSVASCFDGLPENIKFVRDSKGQMFIKKWNSDQPEFFIGLTDQNTYNINLVFILLHEISHAIDPLGLSHYRAMMNHSHEFNTKEKYLAELRKIVERTEGSERFAWSEALRLCEVLKEKSGYDAKKLIGSREEFKRQILGDFFSSYKRSFTGSYLLIQDLDSFDLYEDGKIKRQKRKFSLSLLDRFKFRRHVEEVFSSGEKKLELELKRFLAKV